MCPYWSLFVPKDSNASQLVIIGPYASLWVLVCPYWSLCVLMRLHRF